jgi:hypothetical protein
MRHQKICAILILVSITLPLSHARASTSALPVTTATTDTSADTTLAIPRIGFGVGWQLGSLPVFDLWKQRLPKDVRNGPGFNDSLIGKLTYKIAEDPPSYNTAYPLSLTWYCIAHDNFKIAAQAVYWRVDKTHVGVWTSDTSKEYLRLTQRISLDVVSAGLSASIKIPKMYFSIAGVQESYFSCGVSAIPLAALRLRYNEKSDTLTALTTYDNTHAGIGIGWQACISAVKALSSRSILDAGIGYQGYWMGRFMRNGQRAPRGTIYPSDHKPYDALSFSAHRFIIFATIGIGKKPKSIETAVDVPADTTNTSPPVGLP